MSSRTAPMRLNPGRFIVFATLAFAVCFYGIPLLWLFIAGTRSEASLLTQSPFALGDWDSFVRTWNNLTTYNNFQILTWTVNSLIYVVGGVLLSLIACIPAGYALAASEFPGRKLVLIFTLIAMITPSTAVVLPIFLELNMLGLSNTYAGLILASGFFPFGVYLTYVYFSTSLPKGVMDSARSMAPTASSCSAASRCRWPGRSSRWWRSSASSASGRTTFSPSCCSATTSSTTCRWG